MATVSTEACGMNAKGAAAFLNGKLMFPAFGSTWGDDMASLRLAELLSDRDADETVNNEKIASVAIPMKIPTRSKLVFEINKIREGVSVLVIVHSPCATGIEHLWYSSFLGWYLQEIGAEDLASCSQNSKTL